jgi:hypothetical protein
MNVATRLAQDLVKTPRPGGLTATQPCATKRRRHPRGRATAAGEMATDGASDRVIEGVTRRPWVRADSRRRCVAYISGV